MQAHTVERVESWDSRPFSGGLRELHELADREFTGAVVAAGAWLFMLNGRVVGVFEGDVDDFADADGTVYDAPHPSLALLFAMQERGGETQAKYYTNDTPLSEASETLTDANFTGYIELSENVLSGDYYVVYYGGRSMSAAFVGTSEELLTGDEAFERADDEVGVYEVKKSPVNVTTLPEVEDEPEDASAAAGAAAAGGAADEAADEPDAEDAEAGSVPADEPDTAGDAEREPAGGTDSESPPAATEGADDASADASDTPGGSENAEAGAPTGSAADAADDSESPSRASGTNESTARSDAAAAATADDEGVFDEEEEWRNATSVPTLDPEKSESTDGGSASAQSASTQPRSKRAKQSANRADSGSDARSQSGGKPKSTVEKLKRAVRQRDEKLEAAAERIDDLEGEREDLRERVASLEAERDDLRERADELEADLEAAERSAAASGDGESTSASDVTPAAALSGTNLFVRYGSKGKPTLDDLGPETDLDAVNQNLRIDHHTQFEAADATVDGEDYESFLEASAAYRFVSWAVRELPFEIRDAGHTDGLAGLYDALPDVDRAELDGTVEVETDEGTTTRTFDVVLRDRMGNPLAVAELNPEREPVTGEEMGALVEDATAVREGVDELSAAMYVTASFFEPAALETASEETGGGGFLSRNDKESFVKVGRKSGYHLCLVEDRNDAFHLTVPEL